MSYMGIFLIVLIWVSIGGIAVALYLWRREQSRRDVLERVIGVTEIPAARHQILLPSATADPEPQRASA